MTNHVLINYSSWNQRNENKEKNTLFTLIKTMPTSEQIKIFISHETKWEIILQNTVKCTSTFELKENWLFKKGRVQQKSEYSMFIILWHQNIGWTVTLSGFNKNTKKKKYVPWISLKSLLKTEMALEISDFC